MIHGPAGVNFSFSIEIVIPFVVVKVRIFKF
jgi:hypothetical protein